MRSKKEILKELVRTKLYDDKRIDSLYNNLPKVIYKIMKEANLPTLEKIKGTYCSYRKTKEWVEIHEIVKKFFIQMVEISQATFLEKENIKKEKR